MFDLDPLLFLSVREKEIAFWISQGLDNEEIAERLGITVHTLKSYKTRVFNALDVHSQKAARTVILRLIA